MRQFFVIFVLAVLTAVLPLSGTALFGFDLRPYLAFPPPGLYVRHAGFSFFAFIIYGAAALLPPAVILIRRWSIKLESKPPAAGRFPAWGYAGAALCLVSWLLAWTRLPAARVIQPHTFFPLWLGFIITVNALCERCGRRSALRRRPAAYALLFAASAFFWWDFEWLNRFVQNWTYVNAERFSPGEYFVYATLSFSTVLPAVLAVKELLEECCSFPEAFRSFVVLQPSQPHAAAAAAIAASAVVLFLLGIYPNLLFAALWLCPLAIMCSLQMLLGLPNILSPLRRGDWSQILLWALSAGVCGFFWEMWNFHSYAKWVYHVPYVQALHIFEMPLLGYAGYLPFGVFCGAVCGVFFEDERVFHRS